MIVGAVAHKTVTYGMPLGRLGRKGMVVHRLVGRREIVERGAANLSACLWC
eukprot:CAMPEP_0119372126 /NCGR_PEP_ID=MMETSP1334-20130426/18164_1 /TAXON_ID=127549 /ORGANISM="Calcidiscus leptoporus, Strain RCC1130" /LENGTH=50 /DNA_ID=CAMNT_0007389535 /DNA_START=978 /DNA_END=1127 /DNA_ORIENTATION=-